MQFIFVLAALIAAVNFGGCAISGSPIAQSLQVLTSADSAMHAIPEAPDLRFSYLRVQVAGYPPGLMVLGYVDPHPGGPVEVWYSANRETLRLQNGRVIGMTGTVQDWSSVQFSPTPPDWPEIASAGAQFARQRDVVTAHRYGIREQMNVQVWPALPALALPANLPVQIASGYRWYRESVLAQSSQVTQTLPVNWYAWGKHRGAYQIVFSEQCLAVDFCLQLQRWPMLEEAN